MWHVAPDLDHWWPK